MTPLDVLLEVVRGDIAEFVSEMDAGELDAPGFRFLMRESLEEAHIASTLAAAGVSRVTSLPSATLQRMEDALDYQFERLDGFVAEIAADGWQTRHGARAQMYGRAIKESYGVGQATYLDHGLLPLPYQPAQDTDCHTNCKCAWEIVTVNADLGHFNCWWRRHADDSCDTCLAREAESSPFEVRLN